MIDDTANIPYAGYAEWVMTVQHTGDGFNEVEHGEDEFRRFPGTVRGNGELERLRQYRRILQEVQLQQCQTIKPVL